MKECNCYEWQVAGDYDVREKQEAIRSTRNACCLFSQIIPYRTEYMET
jgi:hypothetical protein